MTKIVFCKSDEQKINSYLHVQIIDHGFFCSLLISSIVTVASYILLSYKSHIVVSRSIQDYKLINKIKFREVNCYLTFCMSAWMLLSIGFNVHLIS